MTAETTVRQLSVSEYYLLPRERKTGLSDYYIREMEHGKGKLFGLVDGEGQILSYAVFTQDGRFCSVSYIETRESLRKTGCASLLLNTVMNADDALYFLHISSGYPTSEAVIGLAQKVGFSLSGQSTIFSAEVGSAMWRRMDGLKPEQMSNRLLKQGGECKPFAELSAEQFKLLENSRTDAFQNQLNPLPFFENETKALDRQMSFAYLKDGELLAYTLVTRLRPDHVVIEQISTADRLIGRGAVVVPLTETLLEIRKNPDIHRMDMTIYDSNFRSRRFVLHLLEGVPLSQVTNFNFFYQRKPTS